MYLFLLLAVINFALAYSLEACLKNDTGDYKFHLGTKTPYRFVANLAVNGKITFQDCEPEKIWMLVRHGTRNPSTSQIAKMKERLPEIRNLILEKNQEPSDRLRSSDLFDLQKWQLKLDDNHKKFLTREGEDEMLELAERMQIRYPKLFPVIYTNTTYFFKFTASQRTEASAQSFITGLFGRQMIKDIWYPTPLKRDPILRFYKLCRKWRSDIKNNLDTLTERLRFKNSTFLESVFDKLNEELRLHIKPLTGDDIFLIYTICAFETAWSRQKSSPWCKVLNSVTLKAMEFLEDLKYYYVDGYGFKLTYQQACPAFNDMLNFFDSNSTYPKATIYFTHSGTILKMLAHLGLYNDDRPLLHTDFAAHEHKWRVSQIDPFGSNIALILHRCGNKKSVMVLHQERVVRLPGCDSDICDLESIKQYYSNSINCNFDEICSN